MKKKERWQQVHDRVLWWMNDMDFKPPELLTEHYFECMAQDIADHATGTAVGKYSTFTAMDRLDPPRGAYGSR